MSADVNFICRIDRELYRVVEQDLLTEEVIITEEQILHIEEGHPGDYGRLSAYISQVLQEYAQKQLKRKQQNRPSVLETLKKFKDFVSLNDLRENDKLKDMVVLQKGSRLSVQPVDKKHFELVKKMGGL